MCELFIKDTRRYTPVPNLNHLYTEVDLNPAVASLLHESSGVPGPRNGLGVKRREPQVPRRPVLQQPQHCA